VRIAVTAGWLAGVIIILAGLPWFAGCLVPAAAAGSVLAWRRWIGDPQILWQLAKDLIRLRKNVRKLIKTGSVVERA
jgi:hypothetical protein